MTREQAVIWHRQLAGAAGMLSGALARGYKSRRLLQDVLSMLKPAYLEMDKAEREWEQHEPTPRKRERVRIK